MKRKLLNAVAGFSMTMLPMVTLAQEAEEGTWSMEELVFAKGRGCSEDTVAVAVSPTAFTVLHDSFYVESGNGVPAAERNKNCHMRLRLNVTPGYQVSLATMDYRGYASLLEGSRGVLQSWYRTKGKRWSSFGTSKTTIFKGPLEEDYFRRDTLRGSVKRHWSPCGGTIEVDLYTHLHAVSRRNSAAYITVDGVDGAAEFRYGLDVRKCR